MWCLSGIFVPYKEPHHLIRLFWPCNSLITKYEQLDAYSMQKRGHLFRANAICIEDEALGICIDYRSMV